MPFIELRSINVFETIAQYLNIVLFMYLLYLFVRKFNIDIIFKCYVTYVELYAYA